MPCPPYPWEVVISPEEDSDLESTRCAIDQAHDRPRAQTVASPAPGDAELTTLALLQALLRGTHDEEALIVAVDRSGFPLAQARMPRPTDLPSAVVLGRHHRCDVVVREDAALALRHFLFVVLPGGGGLRIRCVDLAARSDAASSAGAAQPTSIRASGHLTLAAGDTQLFLLPGGAAGQSLLDGEPKATLARLRNNPTLDQSAGFGPKSRTGRQARVVGGYRSDSRNEQQHLGFLRLRGECDERGRVPHRDVELRPSALRHGLIIGRHAERCTLAGEARNLSRMHALVCEEDEHGLFVFDLASTNGLRPKDQAQGPSHPVVRLTHEQGCLLGQFHLDWLPRRTGVR